MGALHGPLFFDDFFAHFYTGKCGYNFVGGLQNIRIV
jgi:hypothetical protein